MTYIEEEKNKVLNKMAKLSDSDTLSLQDVIILTGLKASTLRGGSERGYIPYHMHAASSMNDPEKGMKKFKKKDVMVYLEKMENRAKSREEDARQRKLCRKSKTKKREDIKRERNKRLDKEERDTIFKKKFLSMPNDSILSQDEMLAIIQMDSSKAGDTPRPSVEEILNRVPFSMDKESNKRMFLKKDVDEARIYFMFELMKTNKLSFIGDLIWTYQQTMLNIQTSRDDDEKYYLDILLADDLMKYIKEYISYIIDFSHSLSILATNDSLTQAQRFGFLEESFLDIAFESYSFQNALKVKSYTMTDDDKDSRIKRVFKAMKKVVSMNTSSLESIKGITNNTRDRGKGERKKYMLINTEKLYRFSSRINAMFGKKVDMKTYLVRASKFAFFKDKILK